MTGSDPADDSADDSTDDSADDSADNLKLVYKYEGRTSLL